MGNDSSCTISGGHVSDYCKMQAAYLCKLIYRDPPGSLGFSTSFPKEIEQAAENWSISNDYDFDFQDECGFVARLYEPKDYDPNAKDNCAMCWPTFVFRGTDFDDFRGLGLIIKFNWPGLNEALEKGFHNLKKHIEAYKDELDKRFDERRKESLHSDSPAPIISLYDDANSYTSNKILNYLDKTNIEEILSTYLDHTFIFEDDPNNPGQKTEYIPEEWQEAIVKQLKGALDFRALKLGGLSAQAQASLDIKIIVRKKEKYGDWATNLLQGVGLHTRAYEYAMQYGSDVMADKIKYTEQKQITFAGHSLGGGLATTANYAAHYVAMPRKEQKEEDNEEEKNAQIYGIVFNPAGVNEYTYEAAAETGTTGKVPQSYIDKRVKNLDDLKEKLNNLDKKPKAVEKPSPVPNLSLALVDIYRVDGEILTQLGLRPHDIPFLNGAMKILGTGLPRPEGNVIVMDPIIPDKVQKDKTNPAQQDQPHFTPPADSEESSGELSFVQYLYRYYANGIDPSIPRISPYMEERHLVPGDVHPSIFPLDKQQSVVNSHKFHNILQLSEKFANYQTMGDFLENVIDFIDENILNGLLKPFLSLAQDNSDVNADALVQSSFWEGVWYMSGLSDINVALREVKDLKEIFATSAEFHGMDYVIASLKHKLGDGAH